MKGSVKIILIVLILAAAIFAAAVMGQREKTVQSLVYQNEAYGYSFKYPKDKAVMVYAPPHVSIGDPSENGFDSYVNVEAVEGGIKDYESYEDFVFKRGVNLCASDGPKEKTRCDKVERKSEYENGKGVSGDEIYFRLIREDVSKKATSTAEFGPVYAFDISANTNGTKYAAIFIYKPLAAITSSLSAQDVADGLDLEQIER